MRKTSIYLDDEQAARLARLARTEGRPQAEIVRDAISCYRPRPRQDRNFALAGNFERIDTDSRPISEPAPCPGSDGSECREIVRPTLARLCRQRDGSAQANVQPAQARADAEMRK